MKQTIEIDVPEGYAYTGIDYGHSRWTEEGECIEVTLFLKKKEPEFIEVRSYLAKCDKTLTIGATVIGCPKHTQPEEIEKYGSFVRWIDEEPRKVEI